MNSDRDDSDLRLLGVSEETEVDVARLRLLFGERFFQHARCVGAFRNLIWPGVGHVVFIRSLPFPQWNGNLLRSERAGVFERFSGGINNRTTYVPKSDVAALAMCDAAQVQVLHKLIPKRIRNALAKGLWLAHRKTGVLERALTLQDYLDDDFGAEYTLVDGFSYGGHRASASDTL